MNSGFSIVEIEIYLYKSSLVRGRWRGNEHAVFFIFQKTYAKLSLVIVASPNVLNVDYGSTVVCTSDIRRP